MSTTAMTRRSSEASPRLLAGIAGVLYLLHIGGCMVGELLVRSRLIVRHDPAATASNILAHEPLFRQGVAAELLAASCFIAAALVFYELLKPVNGSLSLLAAFFGLAEGAIHSLNMVHQLAPVVLLGSSHSLSALATDQLQALAYLSLNLRFLGFNICMVFFGFHFVLLGYLVFRSTFLPRTIGALLFLAGLCCLVNGFGHILSPAGVAPLTVGLLVPFGLARVTLALWLLVRGVNVSKWAAAAEAGQ
jgi:hypothetical protein